MDILSVTDFYYLIFHQWADFTLKRKTTINAPQTAGEAGDAPKFGQFTLLADQFLERSEVFF